MTPPARHVVAANEGAAVALAAGWWLATGEPGVVYMQNSGLGNAINPLLSLAHPAVYSIPMVLLVGWRGTPGLKDEPQHRVQGVVTQDLARLAGVEVVSLMDSTEAASAVEAAVAAARARRAPTALLVEQGMIAPSSVTKAAGWTRHEALRALLPLIDPRDPVVTTTGFIGRDVHEAMRAAGRPPGQDFPCVGAMGHASQIACGIALAVPERLVWCLDGDGSFLMHLGGSASIGSLGPPNLVHVVLDNGVHASVGGMATCAPGLDLATTARALGYQRIIKASDPEGLCTAEELGSSAGPVFVHLRIGTEEVSPLGRPPEPLQELGDAFARFIGGHREDFRPGGLRVSSRSAECMLPILR